jgi:hypothetical protein
MAGRKPTKGDLLELRLARLLFAEGSFVRRSVDLRTEFGSEFTVTDIDVYALRFSPDLSNQLLIAECKSGLSRNAPRAADRLLWGRGVQDLLGADRHLVVTARGVGADTRALASRLGSGVLNETDIERREQTLAIDGATPYGSHDPALFGLQAHFYDAIKGHEDLKRAWRFVHSEGWLAEPVAALKRALGACQLLSRRYGEDTTEAEEAAIGWLLWQAVLVFTVALVRIAGERYRQPDEIFGPWLIDQLSGGDVPAAVLERLSKDVDEYLLQLLGRLGASPAEQVSALGVLAPQPPRYADPLMELVRRFAAEPAAASSVPRLLDWRVAETALNERLHAPWAPVDRSAERLLRLVGAFLRGQGSVRALLLGPLDNNGASNESVTTNVREEVPEEATSGSFDASGQLELDPPKQEASDTKRER